MPTTTARIPAADLLVVDRSLPWLNAANAYSNTSTYALNSDHTSGESDTHAWTGFGFDAEIPPGATIDGVEISLEMEAGLNACDVIVQTYAGALVGAPESRRIFKRKFVDVFGGSSDTMGAGLTAAQVVDPSFGVAVTQAALNNKLTRLYIYQISISVTYTPAAGAAQRLKTYLGGSWVEKPLKVYDGSAWTEKPLKVWNGGGWV